MKRAAVSRSASRSAATSAGALQTIAPLLARGDAACGRVRAFILALTGDSRDAMIAIDAAMPGSWSRVAPFLQRLPTLQPGQKAAAVNLGIFPDSSGTPYASAVPQPGRQVASASAIVTTVSTDRLSEIDELLRAPPPPPAVTTFKASNAPPTQVAYAPPPKSRQVATQKPRRCVRVKSGFSLPAARTPRHFPRSSIA